MNDKPSGKAALPISKRLFNYIGRTEIPLAVYVAIFSTMALLWIFQELHDDLTLGLFTELLGAAFTLFIVDTLLVRAKAKRWQVVRGHVEYLIARTVNRLRDGVSTRVFDFNPGIDPDLSELAMNEAIRDQRAELLDDLEGLGPTDLANRVNDAGAFTEASYDYFNEKADDLWDIINMKYAEYMSPELVSGLLDLHTQLRDACAHIRQYRKAERFPTNATHYQTVGRRGMSVCLHAMIRQLNWLKRQGYSEAARLLGEGEPETVHA